MKIIIPKSSQDDTEEFDLESGLVIIGANGAGKTRFGSKIENLNQNSKRISAQRMLQISENVAKQDFDEAFSNFLQSYKNQSPVTPQNDFQQLLVSIFSEESRRDSNYVKEARNSENKQTPTVPDSVIDKINDIWDKIFPHRKMILENNKVRVKESTETEETYSGVEMSDGEKVGLYLISQVLLASKDSLIIVDEPELHLHKALMARLWNALESFRSDCQFIYITHDLDFAVSKSISQKIWIRKYINNIWTWEFIEEKDVLPENLYIEVAGSRKPILFVEGDRGSLDYKIYQIIYPDFTVVPVGSCVKVIEVVKSFRTAKYLHDVKVCGIIDRDFRSEEELVSLSNEKIFNTYYSEIENILLSSEVIEYVAILLGKDPAISIDKTRNIIKDRIESQLEVISFKKLQKNIMHDLENEISKSTDNDTFFVGLENIIAQKEQFIDKSRQSFDEAKNSDDMNKMLAVFPEKGLSNSISGIFDIKSSSAKPYISLILRKLNVDKSLKDIIKLKLPIIEEGEL
ncbi:MAG: DUF4435 domain-containing protein [Candidatus Moraniibacteriota bacterium]